MPENSELDSEDLLPGVEAEDFWSPQTARSSLKNLDPSPISRFGSATISSAKQAILWTVDLKVWDLHDVHGSPPLQDTPGDALLGRLQLLLDEVPHENFTEFVCWVHEVATGGMKQLSDSCSEIHRELL